MTTVNDILDGIKEREGYISSTRESYDQIASVYRIRRQELLDEMSEVVKAAEAYQENLDNETVLKESSWLNWTEANIFESDVDEAISSLAYELGVERDGSEFWEPSTC